MYEISRSTKFKRDIKRSQKQNKDMKNHSRFLRTVVSLGLMSCREHATHDYKTLFLLDEFPQLGTFKPIKEGLVTLRSRALKSGCICKTLVSLKSGTGIGRTL